MENIILNTIQEHKAALEELSAIDISILDARTSIKTNELKLEVFYNIQKLENEFYPHAEKLEICFDAPAQLHLPLAILRASVSVSHLHNIRRHRR